MENINLDKIIKSDELDTNMILSLPEEIGLKLQKIIQGQATYDEKNSTLIEIIENTNDSIDPEESRKMIFKINDLLLPITILDLPCIIEAQKTIDYKTFYKSGDISQMMYVHDKEFKIDNESYISYFNPFKAGDETFNKLVWKKDYDHKYKCKHGIGKSTKNIRAKRFKRKIRYNHEEILDVAKKLKSIIDNGAANFENQMKIKDGVENLTEHADNLENIENQSFINSTSDVVLPAMHLGNNSSILIKPVISELSAQKKKKVTTEFNIPIPTMKKSNILNFEIALTDNYIVDDNVKILNSKEKDYLNEYNSLKSEYKNLKQELELDNTNDEKLKRKKKIKKRLKEIKKLYKQ